MFRVEKLLPILLFDFYSFTRDADGEEEKKRQTFKLLLKMQHSWLYGITAVK